MPRPSTLACAASLKGVLAAASASAALARGLRAGGARADELPLADGGDGTLDLLHRALGGEWRHAVVPDAFGRPRRARWLALPDGTAAVESAEAVPLDPARLDPAVASSRGLGELIAATGAPARLLVGLGGTATVDGGRGLRETLRELPAPTRALCDVDAPLADAARVFSLQKGATAAQAAALERELLGDPALAPHASLPGAGAAGGLGAALAALGAELVPGSRTLLDLAGFDPGRYDLVVTAEGAVDATTWRGKAPGEAARRCAEARVRCVVAGGRVEGSAPEGVETAVLDGGATAGAAASALEALGRRLGLALVGG